MMGVDAKLEVRECGPSDDGSRAWAVLATSTTLSFSNETSAPEEFRPSMVCTTTRRGEGG